MATGVLGLTLAAGCRLQSEGAAPPPTSASAPEFSLIDHRGRQVTRDLLLHRGPAIVVFYRGFW